MITGAPPSIAAFLGETERGTLEPRRIASFNEFQRLFGRPLGGDKFLADAVSGFFANGGRELFVCRIAAADSVRASSSFVPLEAAGPGAWGNRLFVEVSAIGALGLFRLRIALFAHVASIGVVDPFQDPTTLAKAEVLEDFDDLEPTDRSSPDHWFIRLRQSALIRPAEGIFTLPAEGTQVIRLQEGGEGGPVESADFGSLRADGESVGLSALLTPDLDDISLLAAPAMSDPGLITKICDHCESKVFRLAILDGPRETTNLPALDPRANWDSSCAAYYVPWLLVPDGQGGSRLVPPSGHVAGIFVRTADQRGIWKAPANEQVVGIEGVEAHISDVEQGELNPRGVNAIREFPGRGIRVWGARTLSTDSEFKYVAVRRLLSWIERSLHEGTRWAVFEPNDEPLWMRLTAEIRLFLREQWRAGALFGQTEEEAFFIRCDRTTMTADDILSGRLICLIGVAAVRRREFTLLRISHQTAE